MSSNNHMSNYDMYNQIINDDLNDNNQEDKSSDSNSKKKITSKLLNNPKKTLSLCLNVFFCLVLVFFALLAIVQFIENKNTTLSTTTDNSKNNTDDIYIEVDGLKIVDGDKLMENIIYFENGGEYNFSYNFGDYYADYTAFNSAIPLSNLVGEEVTGLRDELDGTSYYKLLGNDSLDYIITEKNGKYLFYSSSYPYINHAGLNTNSEIGVKYKQVIQDFYGLKRWDDLECIYVYSADEFNGHLDANTKKLVFDETDLSNVYKLLINSVYTGTSIEDYVDAHNISFDYLFDNCVKLGISGKKNVYIGNLYYYAEANVFIDDFNSVILEMPEYYDIKQNYLPELFDINYHPVESSNPEDWEYILEWSNLDSTFLDYVITCGPNTDNHGKYVGSDFVLETYKNGEWTPVPVHKDAAPVVPFYHKLNNDGSKTDVSFYIPNKYYALSAGKYRITITIYDSYSEDKENPAHREFSAEFNFK